MRSVRKAFTLVEILIVVVILGILAAIVIPQFTRATSDAQAGNIQSQLETINSQLELFRARFNEYPVMNADVWTTQVAISTGDIDPARWPGADAGLVGMGYFKAAPRNPYNNLSAVGTAAADDVGWVWTEDDPATPENEAAMSATYFDETLGQMTPGTP